MENHLNQPKPTKPANKALRIVLVIVILAIAGYGIYAYISGNTNTTLNMNAAVNTNTSTKSNSNLVSNINSPSNMNTTVNTSDWKTYNNDIYGFSVKYPSDFQSWEAELTAAVSNSRTDGLLFDVGFRPEGMQGSVFLIRTFSKSLEEVARINPQEHGTLTSETIQVGGKTAVRMTGEVRRYGIQGSKYSYIFTVNNYRNEADLSTFDDMLKTVNF